MYINLENDTKLVFLFEMCIDLALYNVYCCSQSKETSEPYIGAFAKSQKKKSDY